MPTPGKFYTIIDMGKYKRNLLDGIDNTAINNDTMVDLASVYQELDTDDMDVVTDTEDPSGYRGFYIKHSTTGDFTSLGLRGQEPGSVLNDAGNGTEFSTTALNEMKAGISLNNETGFKVNRGQGAADYEDFGKDRIMNINKKGKVTTQHTKELYVQTGSMVANVRGTTGGGGGAGGSAYTNEKKEGGNGGNSGKTWDKIMIYPAGSSVFKMTSLELPKDWYSGGASGGYGGEKSQNKPEHGGDGEDSNTSTSTTTSTTATKFELRYITSDGGTTDPGYQLTMKGTGGGERGIRGNNQEGNGAHGNHGTDFDGDISIDTTGPANNLTFKTPQQMTLYAAGGQGKYRQDGEYGDDGWNASSSIINLLGCSGLHRSTMYTLRYYVPSAEMSINAAATGEGVLLEIYATDQTTQLAILNSNDRSVSYITNNTLTLHGTTTPITTGYVFTDVFYLPGSPTEFYMKFIAQDQDIDNNNLFNMWIILTTPEGLVTPYNEINEKPHSGEWWFKIGRSKGSASTISIGSAPTISIG
jgi:hypothetical protein